MIPKLKNAVWERAGDDLYVVSEPETQIVLSDPTGQVEQLLGLLREGTRDAAQLGAALADLRLPATFSQISDAIAALDELRLLVDAAAPMQLSEGQAERYFSNLAFFTTFASLDQSPASFQGALLDAHVVFLGTGGVGSTAIQAMTGAGVGRMTLLDNDAVELRNFARQYLYRTQDIGMPKVERAAAWVQAFSPGTDVRVVSRWIGGPDDVADLLNEADLVVSGVDQPAGIDLWVNESCVAAGVPYVRGGMIVVFLRTDLYAVLITGLGYLNLTRVSRLQMARRYRRLNESEERELASADPRDKAAARWYAWVQVAGVALAAFYFAAFFAPAGIQLVRWVATGLTTAPATSLRFWEVLVSGWVAALPIIIPPLTYMRDRRRKRG